MLEPASVEAKDRDMCLPGTRVEILRDLFTSLIDPNLGENVIWVRGAAGCGKSTLLNTIAQYFSDIGRCGAFLFWDRNDPVNSNPRRVIRTLAFQLAQFNDDFASELASRITATPSITTSSSLDEQFRHLVQEPLAIIAKKYNNLGPIIIVLDALDECGAPEARKRLLESLSVGLTKLPVMI